MNNEQSLNRICCPNLGIREFLAAAARWGFSGVELRNDLAGGNITDDLSPQETLEAARREGVAIVSINALQRFNDGRPEAHMEELTALASLAKDLGGAALVLCPVNDREDKRSEEERQAHTAEALKAYAPVLREYGVTGLVEPLGFSISSLRTKEAAVRAIDASGQEGYRLVHDSFHHFLAGEEAIYPARTGLIHISGVENPAPLETIGDGDRILIGPGDRMGNKEQLQGMIRGGYAGPISYEAFSPAVQNLSASELEAGLAASGHCLFG